jgi:hypothetical protein
MHVFHPSQVTHRPDWARVGRFAFQVLVIALILAVF